MTYWSLRWAVSFLFFFSSLQSNVTYLRYIFPLSFLTLINVFLSLLLFCCVVILFVCFYFLILCLCYLVALGGGITTWLVNAKMEE